MKICVPPYIAKTEELLKEQTEELAFVRAQRDNLITHAEVMAAEKEALEKSFEELSEKMSLVCLNIYKLCT